MKRRFAILALDEAARLFNVPAADLFCGKNWTRAKITEDAVVFAMWVVGASPIELGQHFGRFEGVEARRRCIRKRIQDENYNELVGELVWFVQHGYLLRKEAA